MSDATRKSNEIRTEIQLPDLAKTQVDGLRRNETHLEGLKEGIPIIG